MRQEVKWLGVGSSSLTELNEGVRTLDCMDLRVVVDSAGSAVSVADLLE